jgi:hypothetical protein
MIKFLVALLCLVSTSSGVFAQSPFNTRIGGFIQNRGQWPGEVLYLHRAPNLDTWVTTTGMVIDQYAVNGSQRTGHVVRMTWQGGNNQTSIVPGPTTATVHYFNGGNGPAGLSSITVDRLRCQNVFDGVSVIYYTDADGRLRFDLDVAPGTSTANIAFQFEGDQGLVVDPTDIKLRTSMGDIVVTDLYAYVFGKKHLQTKASFDANSGGVRISVPQRAIQEPLTVDPVVYGTYVGGTGDDIVKALANGKDFVYMGGTTTGIEFPAGTGKYAKDVAGLTDAFIAAFSKDLRELKAYTYLGGGSEDELVGIDINTEGFVCVAGNTRSSNFPTTIGAVGQIYKAQIDAFITRLPADLSALDISTFIGGNKDDKALGIAVEKTTGAIYVCGVTNSNAQFPITLAHQNTYRGGDDCFLAKLAPGGGTFVFCTYYGKAGNEAFTAIAVDPAGSPYVTGYTTSSDFETAPTPGRFSSGRVPYDRTFNGGPTDAFAIKFFPDGTLSKKDDGTYSTFFGGAGEDEGRGIYIDAQGRAMLIGVTTSSGFPTAGGLFTDKIGGKDIFVCLFTDDGRGLTACTYFGGKGDDIVLGVLPDASLNNGIIWGTTVSQDYPTSGPGAVNTRLGASDAFLTQLNPYAVKFSTLIGGDGTDTTVAVVQDGSGDLFFAVRGTSDDLPTTDGAWKDAPSGGVEGYVGKWAQGVLSLVVPNGGESWCVGFTRSISWAADGILENDRFTVRISSDNGNSWKTAATNVSGLSYSWKPDNTYAPSDEYVVEITTARGHIVRSNLFTLNSPPAITKDPAAASACAGEAVSLTVEATGVGLRYQWRKGGTNIPGATQAAYEIANVTTSTSGSYDCVVTGSCTPNATSKPATVSVAAQTAVTSHPKDVTVKTNQSFSLTVVASGSTLTYKWMRNGTEIAGANAATYTVNMASAADAGTYKCEVTGGCGTATSNEAVVTFDPTSVQEDVVAGGNTLRVLGPIPATDLLSIRLTMQMASTDAVLIRCVSADGSVVMVHNAGSMGGGENTITFPVASLASGVYGLEVAVGANVLRTAIQIAR